MHITRRRMLAGLAACPVCVAAAGGAKAKAPHWAYEGNHGPDHWGDLEPANRVCSIGDQQSPIDLTDAVKAELPKIAVHWKSEAFQLENNGHTIQLNATPGSYVQISGHRYDLVQFHFHTPSEHAVDGKRMDMEAHFIHQGLDKRLGVLGVLMVSGAANATFHEIMQAAPTKVAKVALPTPIDAASLLPTQQNSIWRYEGSLTTPPCSQTVNWVVLEQTIPVDAGDIAAFRRIFPMNARPLQKLNRRFVLRS
jgi:carbonic anhydrase